jgi:hypothetical protein
MLSLTSVGALCHKGFSALSGLFDAVLAEVVFWVNPPPQFRPLESALGKASVEGDLTD